MKKTFSTFVIFIFFSLFSIQAQNLSDGLKLHYTFNNASSTSVTDESGNGYTGTLYNGAEVVTDGKINALKLGYSNGYLDMGTNVGGLISSLNDFSIATYLYIDPNVSITGNGNFLWEFSTSSNCSSTSGKYVAYRVNVQRYAETLGGYKNEVGFSIGSPANQGEWHHVVYTQSGNTGTIYIDGIAKSTGTASLKPSDMGEATTYNWLGRPQFSSDNYLKGASLSDFRIYNRALSGSEVSSFTDYLSTLNYNYDSIAVEKAKVELALAGIDALRSNITLPVTVGENVSVKWTSSNTNYLSNIGDVTRPSYGSSTATVTLEAKLSRGIYSTNKSFSVKIIPQLSDADAAKYDAEQVSIENEHCSYLTTIHLPSEGLEGSLITWESSAPEYITNSGNVINLPTKGSGTKSVTLTATFKHGTSEITKNYPVCLKEDEGFDGYLWAYFTGNAATTQENIFFALSSDGLNFKALNGGECVIKADTISKMNGVRDPHIMRGADGNFYMVVTDMQAALGWSSNHGIVLMKSSDLVHWEHHAVDIKAKYSKFSNITRAWAPETFYDEKTGKYMVYFSMIQPGGHDIIYYSYANDDFTDLATEPQVLFDNGVSTIDGNIVYRHGVYNLFFKTEDASDKGYKKAVSTNLTDGYTLIDKYLDQSNDAVEGACVFKLNNKEKYILMYDLYTTGKYQFTISDSLDNFKVMNVGASWDFHPRHGTIMGISNQEVKKLVEQWGDASMVAFGDAEAPEVKQINVDVDETAKTVFIPVKYGTDLSHFDPQITASVPGITVTPQGAQNFSNGTVVPYTFSLAGTTKTYDVTVAVNNNSIVDGYFADPDILYSEKTGKFYIYPTSDGYSGWGGYYFNVFSSPDLVNWTNEGVIIDMHDSNQISWANGNAWAPTILEKKINGEYKYVFYFSGGLDGGSKKLGYAVANNPTGPFTVSSAPLITTSPAGSGQQIDADLFTDPITDQTYLYWGNGYMAVAALNDDLTSLKTTPTVITPSSHYTEATNVFYRNGKYYFLWSYGNTGNANYSVYYGYSASPLGPITIPNNNCILQQDASLEIYGPGHNSVIQIPQKDEWYIVYHRISRPNGINNTTVGAGNVRELCIDKLEFNSDGTIKPTQPTLEGIQPVDLSNIGSGTLPVFTEGSNGAVIKTELYSISGKQLSVESTGSIIPGVYILKKTYENGYVGYEKTILTHRNINQLLGKNH